MNKLGKKWMQNIRLQTKGWTKPTIEDSFLQERMMRVGKEAKMFGVDKNDIETIKQIAITTILEDNLNYGKIKSFSFKQYLKDNPLVIKRSLWRRFCLFFKLAR